MKYTTASGEVIKLPGNLGPKQLANAKAMADGGDIAGAIARAKQLSAQRKGKGIDKNPNQGGGNKPSAGKIGSVINKDGTIKPGQADTAIQAKETQDVETNFNLATPGSQTDQWGNSQTTARDPVTGQVTISQNAGSAANAFRDAALGAATGANGQVSRQNAQNAAYDTITKRYDRDRDRDLESAKQEMANRGIPYNPGAAFDPNSKDLYGRTIGSINERYSGMKDDASNQAILAGNSAYATDAQARDSFINSTTGAATNFSGKFTPYQGTSTDSSGIGMDVMNLSAQQFLAKYGIDKNAALEEKKIGIADKTANAAIAAANKPAAAPGGGFQLP